MYKYHLFLSANSRYIIVTRCTVEGGIFESIVKLMSVAMQIAVSVPEAVS